MHAILSQLDKVEPGFLSQAAILALVALGAAVAAVTLWNAVRSRPPHETPTRREFDCLATKVDHIETSLPNMERRILDGVRAEAKELTAKLEELAKTDHEERGEIWKKLHAGNEKLCERVARLEAGGGGAKKA